MKTFYLGRENITDELIQYKDAKEADYKAEEWVRIEAKTLKDAMNRYELEFQRWRYSQGFID